MELEPRQVAAIATLPHKIQRNLNLADRLYCAIRAVNEAQEASFGNRVRVARQEAVTPLLRALNAAAAYARDLRKDAEALRYEVRNTAVIEIADRAGIIERRINKLIQKAEMNAP